MTVGELIEHLKGIPPDTRVLTFGYSETTAGEPNVEYYENSAGDRVLYL